MIDARTSQPRSEPLWIEPAARLCEAAARMKEAGTSSILVGKPGELVSILTERDVAHAVAAGASPATPAGELAMPRPLTVDLEASVHSAGRMMLEHNVRHLVVTSGNQAMGVLSIRDVLAVMLASSDTTVLVASMHRALLTRPEHWWG
jgi:signal-transduction protein with cAMP-binding, CBS, and nucleotidyltransferase domain